MHAGANSGVSTCHEQVATMVDMRDVGQPDAKLQFCKSARPGMKISGKETDAVMGLVNAWWQEELQPDHCWAVIDVPGHINVLVRYENRPAGDYHAICASMKHQGSSCAWLCLWCEVWKFHPNSRQCKICDRFSCQHTAFTGIHRDILRLKEVMDKNGVPASEQLGPEPP
jgi:hypothetical protein